MAIETLGAALGYLNRLFAEGTLSGLSDDQLLDPFLATRDGAAFEALVARHGPMVLRVCRVVLRNPSDAEDAFQATFLVLVKKARTLRGRANLGGWLHLVAYRVAIQANAAAARRRVQERRAGEMSAMTTSHDPIIPDGLLPALHEEIARLPEKIRLAVVLCDLQGIPQEKAAESLRLSERLKTRLSRRGLECSGAVLAAVRLRDAGTMVPPARRESTLRAALDLVNSTAGAGAVSAAAQSLTYEVLKTMFLQKLAMSSAALLGAGLMAWAAAAVLIARGDVPRRATTTVEARRTSAAESARLPQATPADASGTIPISGRVLDPGGQPVGRARVAVQVTPTIQAPDRGIRLDARLLGEAETDGRGEFRMTISRISSANSSVPVVIAGAPGYGVGGRWFGAEEREPVVTITLDAEQAAHGRLITAEGHPAAGVVVHVQSFESRVRGAEDPYSAQEATKPPSCWPRPATTDADGRFAIHGLGKSTRARLAVRDDRFAPQTLEVGEAGTDSRQGATWRLTRARPILIRVVHADDRRPVLGAEVVVWTQRGGPSGTPQVDRAHGWTDERGRFRTIPAAGDFLHIGIIPPAGEPYLILQR